MSLNLFFNKQFVIFILVSVLGLIFDILVFYLILHNLHIHIALARALSFLVAVHISWLGHRYYTFSNSRREFRQSLKQWRDYLAIRMVSLFPNLTIFMLLLYLLGYDFSEWDIIISFALGNFITILFNYVRNVILLASDN